MMDGTMIGTAPQLIEGPSAWRSAEPAADPSWRRTLTAEEIAALVEAMDMIHEIVEEVCLEMPFETGDTQFMNQHVTYHGRISFTDDATTGAQRVLMRIWLSAPFTRSLPEGHAVQWGDTRAGAVRGGAVPGKSAIAHG